MSSICCGGGGRGFPVLLNLAVLGVVVVFVVNEGTEDRIYVMMMSL